MTKIKKIICILVSILVLASAAFFLFRKKELDSSDIFRIAQMELKKHDVQLDEDNYNYVYTIEKENGNIWNIDISTKSKKPGWGVAGGGYFVCIDGNSGEVLSSWGGQ